MKIEVKKLSTPIKVTILEEAKDLKVKKEELYKSLKKDLETDGFRKGHVPRDVAERTFGVEKLYRKIIDSLYLEAVKQENIIISERFQIFGDLSDTCPLRVEFIAEVEPKVTVAELNQLKIEQKQDFDISETEINEAIDIALKQNEQILDTEKEILEQFDVAIIDFEGTLEGESEPFKGGVAKNYQLSVDLEHKTFIDNFEEQIIGMKIKEIREVKVKFPENYRDITKANKKARFKVTLNAIKRKLLPELDAEFAKKNGFNTVEEYKESIRVNQIEYKKRIYGDELKRNIIIQLLEKSEFSPIPMIMIEREAEREWHSFLNRMGESEEEYLKKDVHAKEIYLANTQSTSEELIKTSLLFKAIAKKFDIKASKEDITRYVTNVSKGLSDEQKQKNIDDLENKEIYNLREKAVINEKVVDFLISHFTKDQNDKVA